MARADKKVVTQLAKPIIEETTRNNTDNNGKQIQEEPYKMQIVWRNVIIFAILHVMAIYGVYLYVTAAKAPTMIHHWVYAGFGGIGITGGAHRLWAHRAYKARLPMRILLMLMQSVAHQNTIYEWARDHRAHHKFTDTNADPHNASRGFFFSHMGWLLVKKHPDITKRGKGIDMSDVANDPVIIFQKRYFYIIMPLMCFIIPTWIPIYFWGESVKVAFFLTFFRYIISLHYTWLVNSAAHLWGNKPYDKFISPTENVGVSILAYGEGWHNYHHVFPWDYKAAELGNYWTNLTTLFIDLFAKLDLAYDLKTVSMDVVRKQSKKRGDGSWNPPNDGHSHQNDIWGWNDKDITQEDKEATRILRKPD